jgi:hypothetical protein
MGYSVKPALLGRDGLPIKISGRPDYWIENQNKYKSLLRRFFKLTLC